MRLPLKMRKEYILLAVYPLFPSRFKVEDTCSDVRILALADFTFAVKIPNRLRQGLDDIRPFSFQRIVDMVHGGDVRLSTFKGSRYAEKAYKIRVVCMEKLTDVELIGDNTTQGLPTGSGHTVHSSDIS